MPEATTNPDSTILALDVGSKRIGVALARADVKLARPLTTLANDETFWACLDDICRQETTAVIVVGLPRSLEGTDTAQTRYVRQFVGDLQQRTELEIVFQDEAVTSQKAEAELKARGKSYDKGEVDALAATYILEDYLQERAG